MSSNNSRAIRMEFETLRSIDGLAIPAGTYVGGNIGGPMLHSIVQFKIDNFTDAHLVFSKDGINDHFVLCPSGFWLSDVSSNQITNQGLQIAKGDSFYVKQLEVPTTGTVYRSVIYGDTGI